MIDDIYILGFGKGRLNRKKVTQDFGSYDLKAKSNEYMFFNY